MIKRLLFYVRYYYQRLTLPSYMFKHYEDDGVLGYGVGQIGKNLGKRSDA